MKKLQQLYLALLVFCIFHTCCHATELDEAYPQPRQPAKNATAAEVGGTFSLKDSELYKLYRGTLVGYTSIDEKIIDLINKVKCSPTVATIEEMQAVRDFYFSKFFEYMDGLKITRTDETKEFKKLWDDIYAEATKASETDLEQFDWRLIKVIFIRGLLLASGKIIEDVEDVLSKVPGTKIFFAAMSTVTSGTDTTIPAWQHSSALCIANLAALKTKPTRMQKIKTADGTDDDTIELIIDTANYLGLREGVFVPISDLGSLGITAILKMWLNHVYPVPLTYGTYRAHGLELNPAIGAMHDFAHGSADNRFLAVLQAILNLLKSSPTKKINNATIKLATNHIVERYLALNEIFKKFLAYKEATLLEELQDIARIDTSDPGKSKKIKIAKQKYNRGIAALFYALHEKYALTHKVLEQETFAEAIERFCKNTTKIRDSSFVDLETLFNPKSDLSNEQIIEAIKSVPLSAIGKSFDGAEVIGEHPYFNMEGAVIARKDVHTEISFPDELTGKTITLTIRTEKYAFATYDDENTLLKLVGADVPKPVIDMDAMQVLPVGHDKREAAKQQVTTWLTAIDTGMATMMRNWITDLMLSKIASEIVKYDSLLAEQNAEWKRLFKPGLRRVARCYNLG